MQHAIDGARLTWMHMKIWALSAMGVALDGFDFFIIGVALPFIQKDLKPSTWEVGAIGAAAVLGAVLGAMCLGPITDRLGRKAMYMFDLMFFIAFSVLSALAWDPRSLIVFRFLLGIGIGADYPISATFVAETMPSRLRGRMVSSTIGFQALGMLGGALVGLVIILVYEDVSAWRWMLGVGVIPALFITAMRATVPESPRWLASHGRIEEANRAAAQLLGPGGVHRTDMTLEQAEPKPAALGELLSPALIRRTILATVPWFLMDIATYGVGLFTPSILATIAFSHDVSFLSREISSIEGAAFLDMFLIVGFTLAFFLIDKLGRIRLQLLGFAAMALGLGILGLATALPGGGDKHILMVFTGFIIFNMFMNLGPNTTTYVLPAEVFPTRLRASGHGIAAAAGKLGAAVGIFFLPILQTAIGLGLTLGLVAAAAILGFLVTWLCQVETAGRSLREFE